MKYALIAAVLAASVPAIASAQSAQDESLIEPYIGLVSGYELFDKRSEFGTVPGFGALTGGVTEGVAGVNVPLGPLFAGVEGSVAKGTKGDIHWEYGVKARVGARAGLGLIYVSAGKEWIKGTHGFGDRSDMLYGLGVEVNFADIGLADVFGTRTRLRLSTETYDFDSIRPMMGTVFTF